MLLRILVLTVAAAYVCYRVHLIVALARARRRGDTERERAVRARAFAVTRWAIGTLVLAGLLLVLLVALNLRR